MAYGNPSGRYPTPASRLLSRRIHLPLQQPALPGTRAALPSSCNSARNADLPTASAQLVRITHPFHPFAGHLLPCIGERYNRSGKRLLLRAGDGTICSIPPQWTDLASPEPEVVIGRGRALFRFADLMDLASLVTRLCSERRSEPLTLCKD